MAAESRIGRLSDFSLEEKAGQYDLAFFVSDGVLQTSAIVRVVVTPAPFIRTSSATLSFGEILVGSSLAQTLVVSNPGTAPLSITNIGLAGADASQFQASPKSLTAQPGGEQSIQVVFEPTASGGRQASLTLTHNAAGNSTVVPLTGRGALASINLLPSALSFGNVKIGQSARQTLTVSNPGALPLSVSGVSSGDPQFTVSTTQFQVAPGGDQQVAVTFTPTSAGAKTATLSIAHNAGGSPTSVSMSGTGAAPDIDASATFAVGAAGVGQETASVLKLLNRGASGLTVTGLVVSDAQFVVSSPPLPFTIQAEGAENLTVTFKPTAVGQRQATLTVSSDDPDEARFDIRLAGVGTGVRVGVSATAVDFGQVTVGQTRTRTVSVVNTGNTDFSVSDVAIAGGKEFVVTSPRVFSVRGGESQPINIDYRPAGLSVAEARLSVVGKDTTFVIGLSGAGIAQAAPVIRVTPAPPDSLLFGLVNVGQARTFNFTLFNDGNAPLVVHSIVTTEQTYTVSPDTLSVLPGRGRTVAVTFTPVRGGFFPAQVRVSSNDPAPGRGTVVVLASGRGVADPSPKVSVTPRFLNFGSVLLNKTKTLSLLVSNIGGGTLRVVNVVSSSEDFTVSETAFSLRTGEEKTLAVTFLPSRAGVVNEVLTLPSNDPSAPIVEMGLRATVITAPPGAIVALPASLSFGQVGFGKAQDFNLQVRNEGGGPLSVSNVTSDNNQVRAAPTSLTVQPGKTTTVLVTYRPVPRRERAGNLTIASDDPERPRVVVSWTAQEPGAQDPSSIALSDASLTFGVVTVNRNASRTLSVSNTGAGSLHVWNIASSDSAFSVPTSSISVAPGARQDLEVTFRPTRSGESTARLTFSTNDPLRETGSVELKGMGDSPPRLSITGIQNKLDVKVAAGDTLRFDLVIEDPDSSAMTLQIPRSFAQADTILIRPSGLPIARRQAVPQQAGPGPANLQVREFSGLGPGRYGISWVPDVGITQSTGIESGQLQLQVKDQHGAASQPNRGSMLLVRILPGSGVTPNPGPDFDGNGEVNFDDFFLFATAFGAKRGDPGFNPKFDLDNSGAVDFDDFFILATSFGKRD